MDNKIIRNCILLFILLILPLLISIAPLSLNSAATSEPVETPVPNASDSIETEQTTTLAIMLCLDVSGSMSGSIGDLKNAAQMLLNLLDNDTYIGLVEYATSAYLLGKLYQKSNTTHFHQLQLAVNAMYASGNTNIDGGLTDCIDEFTGSSYDEKHIILMSDGETNTADFGRYNFTWGTTTGGPGDGRTWLDHWVNDSDSAINLAEAAGICINTVGFGYGYDETFLKAVADGTGCGQFYDAANVTALAMAFAQVTHVLEGWSDPQTFYGSVNVTIELVGTYTILSGKPFVRIILYWDDPAWNLSLIVKDQNGNELTPLEQSAAGERPVWAVYDCSGLTSITIYVQGIYTMAMSRSYIETNYGLYIASNGEYKDYTPGGKGVPISLIWLYLGLAFITAILFNKRKIKF